MAVTHQDALSFNVAVKSINKFHEQSNYFLNLRVRGEYLFTSIQPFYKSMIIYLILFLGLFFSWLKYEKPLTYFCTHLLTYGFIIHTVGIISRMILQGRPPVTNLYSSAVFVGWAAVLLCIILERFFKNRIGLLTASVIRFLHSTLIKHGKQRLQNVSAIAEHLVHRFAALQI